MCLHKYSKWSEPYVYPVLTEVGHFGDKVDGECVGQSRTCEKCGFVKTRKLAHPNYDAVLNKDQPND